MIYSFADHFSAIESRLVPDLADHGHAAAMRDLCLRFPYDIASDFGFESRLGDPEPGCDFFLMIRKGSEGAAILAGKSKLAELPAYLKENPFWERLTALFASWYDTESFLAGRIEMFWLEFDQSESSFNIIPNIFFRITENRNESRVQQWESTLRVLDEIYRILFDVPFPKKLAETLKTCILALPAGARLYQTGFMIPRKTEAIRLVLTNFKSDSLSEYLQNIDWPGETDKALKVTRQYEKMFDFFVYNLNIGEKVLPFLGIEMYLSDMKQPQYEPRWNSILDRFEKEKLLLPSKREALLRFCGRRSVSHFYPVRYICGINHLKYTCRKGMADELKGYFGTMIRPETKKTQSI